MTKLEKIIKCIQNMTANEMVSLHNEYCYETNCFDDEIFDTDRLDEICNGQSVEWIIHRVYFGEYHPQADYIKFNGYGNFQSIFKYELSEYIDETAIAEYIIENDECFYNDDIKAILEEEEEEENND